MAIHDIYSKRMKKAAGDVPDVYKYDELPSPLRVQIVQLWDTYSFYASDYQIHQFNDLAMMLRHEYGVLVLPSKNYHKRMNLRDELINFFLEEKDINKALDAVELSFKLIVDDPNFKEFSPDPVEELNYRFNEHGVGYKFDSQQIIQIDSEFVHSEVVIPALRLLNQKHFAGAQEEFLKAHGQYRKGQYKEALDNCLKAFESVMKAICDKKGWKYSKTATAKILIKICFDNGLIPLFWQKNYSTLIDLLRNSVPTGRNKVGGHGQGTTPITVPDYLVAYMIHMTASAIVFLAEAEKNYPSSNL